MNSNILLSFLPIAIPGVIFIFFFGFFNFLKLKKRGRKSPLTRELLRGPGESLRHQITEIDDDVDLYLFMIFVLPFLMYSSYLSQIYFGGYKPGLIGVIIIIFVPAAIFIFWSFKLWKLLKQRNNLRLGLDCELAVGEELNQLMLEGCRVFHDFPVKEFNKEFNIDHIVVSPKGVFAIETKGRAKPDKNVGSAEATVVYNGQSLKFPSWIEKDPIEQARRNADWLSKWLGKAVGEAVQVYPVLALPGWWIEREVTDDMFVFNGKNPQNLLKRNGFLSPELMKHISHQLEQKCRDVEPTAYRQAK